jgi:hypothetical protein
MADVLKRLLRVMLAVAFAALPVASATAQFSAQIGGSPPPFIGPAMSQTNGNFVQPADVTATTQTTSFTVLAVPNPVLIMAFQGDLGTGVDDISSVTYSGSPMTLAVKYTAGGSSARMTYMYYMASPPAGTANVVVTAASSHFIGSGVIAEYSGVNQAAPLGATVAGLVAASGTSASQIINNTNPSQFLVEYCAASTGNGYNSSTDYRRRGVANTFAVLYDSGSVPLNTSGGNVISGGPGGRLVGSGNYTFTCNNTGTTQHWVMLIVAFIPA